MCHYPFTYQTDESTKTTNICQRRIAWTEKQVTRFGGFFYDRHTAHRDGLAATRRKEGGIAPAHEPMRPAAPGGGERPCRVSGRRQGRKKQRRGVESERVAFSGGPTPKLCDRGLGCEFKDQNGRSLGGRSFVSACSESLNPSK